MTVPRSWPKTAVVAGLFLTSFVSLQLVSLIPGYRNFFQGLPELWWWIENATRPLIPIVAGLWLLFGPRPRAWLQKLGLDRPFFPALVLALCLTAPLTLIPLLLGMSANLELGFIDQLFGAGIWPLAEEINFRGFAFGQIYAFSGLGFWPAGLLTSTLFGVAHMANAAAAGMELSGQLMNAAITGASALVLAWIYFRWGQNLWLVFFLHGIGNLVSALYTSGDVAVGNNLFISLLVVTAFASILVTAFREKIPWTQRVVGNGDAHNITT